MTAIHPSILNCDIAHLADELDRVTGDVGAPGADGVWTVMGEVSPPPVGRVA